MSGELARMKAEYEQLRLRTETEHGKNSQMHESEVCLSVHVTLCIEHKCHGRMCIFL